MVNVTAAWQQRHAEPHPSGDSQRGFTDVGSSPGDTDGGYWLIGFSRRLMRKPQHWPLIGIPWGGSEVLDATLAAAQRVGLSVALLQSRCDIDHLEDLKPWQG